ncbi:MAG TPA: TIGR02996 domain-containing protein [Kofleriaceae bacterium]|nr:TIGR02996 domain-containing protein [Kofleriaceae bacterium]
MDVGEALGKAETALGRDDRVAALGHLLEAWRACRQPRIADLIDVVSAAVTRAREPIASGRLRTRLAAWKAVAARRDPADVGRLVKPPWRPSIDTQVLMARTLAEWPDDPRIAMFFAELLEQMREPDTGTATWHYRPMLVRVAELRDERALAIVREVMKRPDARTVAMVQGATWTLEGRARDGRGELSFEDADVMPMSPETERIVERIEAGRGGAPAAKLRGEADFLAAIYAEPDAMGLREVYADWLQERDDPRGELIMLQLAREQGRAVTPAVETRERELLAKYGRRWAGKLDRVFDVHERVWQAGFLVGGQPTYEGVRAAARDDPAWAMVREISGEDADEIVDWPQLAGLRAVHDLPVLHAARIARGPRRPLVELGWRMEQWTRRQRAPLGTCKALPKLRLIGIRDADGDTLEWLPGTPVMKRIECVRLYRRNPLRPFLEAVARLGGRLRRLELTRGDVVGTSTAGWWLVLERDEAPGPFTRAVARFRPDVRFRGSSVRSIENLSGLLFEVPKGWLRELVVEPAARGPLSREERAELEGAIEWVGDDVRVVQPWDFTTGRQRQAKR